MAINKDKILNSKFFRDSRGEIRVNKIKGMEGRRLSCRGLSLGGTIQRYFKRGD